MRLSLITLVSALMMLAGCDGPVPNTNTNTTGNASINATVNQGAQKGSPVAPSVPQSSSR